jgi:hypothetical protein
MITPEMECSSAFGQVRSQGVRPTCLAFVASDLNAAANATVHLSVDYLCHHAAKLSSEWKPGEGFTLDAVLGAVETSGQPHEDRYPYHLTDHSAPLREPPGGLEPLYRKSKGALDMTYKDVCDGVRAGRALGIIIAVTVSLFQPTQGVVDFDPYSLPDQYHAVVAVGTGKDSTSGEFHLLVRNSWGPAWGHAGHAWLPESHLNLHFISGFAI